GQALRILFFGLAGTLVAIHVARRYVMSLDQEWKKGFTTPRIATDCQSAERVAMVALTTSDEMPPRGFAFFDEILASQLECRLDRLGSARNEIHVVQIARRTRREKFRQILACLSGEKGRVDISHLVELLLDSANDVRMVIAQARDSRTAAGVDIAAAITVENPYTFAACGKF